MKGMPISPAVNRIACRTATRHKCPNLKPGFALAILEAKAQEYPSTIEILLRVPEPSRPVEMLITPSFL
jgi:hypothetical protein